MKEKMCLIVFIFFSSLLLFLYTDFIQSCCSFRFQKVVAKFLHTFSSKVNNCTIHDMETHLISLKLSFFILDPILQKISYKIQNQSGYINPRNRNGKLSQTCFPFLSTLLEQAIIRFSLNFKPTSYQTQLSTYRDDMETSS